MRNGEDLEGFVEEFPDVEATANMFEIDRNRFTASGGTAPIDLMLNLVARQVGTRSPRSAPTA